MPERAHVDRIDGDRAVLLVGADGRDAISIPSRLLPEGATEGSALEMTLTLADNSATRAEIDGLMDDLFGGSGG